VSTFLYALFYSMAEILIDFVPAGQIPTSLRDLLNEESWSAELRPSIVENVRLCSVEMTTRPKEENEVDREEYRFMSREDFGRMVEEGRMLEHWEEKGKPMPMPMPKQSLCLSKAYAYA
jgi:hypothetical protein